MTDTARKCVNCGAETYPRTDSRDAVEAWNRRAYDMLYDTILEYQMRGYSRRECLDALGRGGGL